MKKRTVLFTLICCLTLCLGFKSKPDTYTLDVGHTYIGFDVERFLVGEVSGRFNDFSAQISMEDQDPTTLQLNATIQVGSLDSNNAIRDGHLKGENWLDAAAYPEITFASSEVIKNEQGGYNISGDFTIHGVTKKVTFPMEVLGPFKDPTQKIALGIKADFTIDRFDYGIAFNRKMDNGSFFIGNEVKIKIRALALLDN